MLSHLEQLGAVRFSWIRPLHCRSVIRYPAASAAIKTFLALHHILKGCIKKAELIQKRRNFQLH